MVVYILRANAAQRHRGGPRSLQFSELQGQTVGNPTSPSGEGQHSMCWQLKLDMSWHTHLHA